MTPGPFDPWVVRWVGSFPSRDPRAATVNNRTTEPSNHRTVLGQWSFVVAVALLYGAAAFGCARRGTPVVPSTATPEPVADLSALPQDNAIALSWSRPTRLQDGRPLTAPPDFRLYRRVSPIPSAESAAGAPAPVAGRWDMEGYTPVATVRGERPDNARVEGNLYAYRDDDDGRGLAYGQRYEYRLVARDVRGYQSPPSNAVRVDLRIAPSPPGDLRAREGEGRVDLAWSAPTTRVDGEPLGPVRGYNIYRGEEAGTFPGAPVNPQPVTQPRYTDAGLANDKTYFYVVRVVDNEAPPWQESGNSNMAAATPRDVTPPFPPRGLQAAATRGEVALIWDPNDERDLAGYHVYRSEVRRTAYRRLTDRPIQDTTFSDRTVARATTYYYVITAVDNAATPNESLYSDEIAVRAP